MAKAPIRCSHFDRRAPRILVAALLVLAACAPPGLNATMDAPDWPPLLGAFADYQAVGAGEVGDRLDSVALLDHVGGVEPLARWLGRPLVVERCVTFDGTCQATATKTAELAQRAGVTWLTILAENDRRSPPNQGELLRWRGRFDLEHAVLADHIREVSARWRRAEAWPELRVIGLDGEILDLQAGPVDEAALLAAIDAAYGD